MMRRFWAVSAMLGVIGGAFLLGDSSVARGQDGVALASAKLTGNWSQWRGPMRDGVYLGGAWPETLAGKLQLVWEKELGPSYSGPVSDGELVFTTETVDKMFERVSAYRMSDGEQVWRVEWEGAMAVPFFAAANGDWIRSTPALANGKLVVAGMRDVVVCLDAKTGKEEWRVDFADKYKSNLQAFGCVCSPIIDGDFVYIQAGGGTTKLALKDGSLVWQALKDDGSMMTGGAFSSPIIATIDGQRQLVVATRMALAGVSLEDGRELWNEKIESFRGMNILTPVVTADGKVFSSAHSGKSRMLSVASENGSVATVKQLWDNKAQGYMSSPVVIGDYIYLHMKNQRFVCLDMRDGTEKWTTQPFGKYWSMVGNPKTAQILALDETGQLRLIAADPAGYRLISEEKVADDSWAHLAVQPIVGGAGDKDQGLAIIVRALDRIRVYRWQ